MHGSQANLSGSDLSGANLQHAWLTKADLRGADLSSADLTEANLSGADLRGAKFFKTKLRRTNLSGADLSGVDLSAEFSQAELGDRVNFNGACLRESRLWMADLRSLSFRGADLRGAYLGGAQLRGAVLCEADLRGAYLDKTHLEDADFRGAHLEGANLTGASLKGTDLRGAHLAAANLQGAQLIASHVDGADLSRCQVYGLSVWDLQGVPRDQTGLVITSSGEATITLDDLEVAQFIHLLLRQEKLRNVIDSITSKVVLILGRFTPERKAVLDALAGELRKHNLLPIIFDFERSTSLDMTESIKTLVGLSFFVIADITNPKSAPLELQATIPDYQVPFVQIIQQDEAPFSMYVDLANKYDWVLQPVLAYASPAQLLQHFQAKILDRAWEKRRALEKKKAEALKVMPIESFLNESD